MSETAALRQPAPLSGARKVVLPVDLTSFVGRERELTELARLLPSCRLLTLTGAGGSGKTRLALELVTRDGAPGPRAECLDVAWAELASLEDPSLVPRRIAEALGIGEEVRASSADALVELVADRRALLVLDNCEHVVEKCADVVDALLRGCPQLRILATSREALGVRGERAWLVPPLSLPDERAGADALARSEAVRLFVERAREVVPAFELGDANSPAVLDICRRLDGIPLAIELAAARVRMLPPEQIRDRLDDAFRLLTSGGRTALPRHRTLRAAIDWSYDLLPQDEKRLLARLSVFRGGFTLDAVESVAPGGAIDADAILDLLGRLVDRSLIVVREHAGAARYALLETVRQYATLRLAEAGEESDVRRRHADWILALIAEAEPHFTTAARRVWFDRLLPDIDNIRDALEWTRAHDAVDHIRLVILLDWFWYSTAHWNEALAHFERALAMPQASAPHRERAALLFATGALYALQARVLLARPLLEEAQRLAAAVGDPRLQAYARNYLAMTWAQEGAQEAVALCEAAADWFRRHDEPYGLRLSLLLIGIAQDVQGRSADALRSIEEAVEIARAFGPDRELAIALETLAFLHLRGGDPARAAAPAREALVALSRDPSYLFTARGLEYFGEAIGARGRPAAALRLIGAARAIRDAIGAQPFKVDAERLASSIAAFRAAIGPAAGDEAWSAGRALRPELAIAEALALDDAPPPPAPAASMPRHAAPGLSAASTSPELSVRALGPLQIESRGTPVDPEVWKYARPRELLLYLLCHPGGRTRDQIGVVFWSEASPSQVKNSLHVAVHRLRKALVDPGWIVLDQDRYRVAPDRNLFFDAATFERDATAALRRDADDPDRILAMERAIALHRGEFLENESAGDWHLEVRERLARRHAELCMALGATHFDAGRWEPAAAAYERLVLADVLDEEVYRRLMLCRARSGDRVRALRLYQRLAVRLRDELDTEPETETARLLERLRRDDPV